MAVVIAETWGRRRAAGVLGSTIRARLAYEGEQPIESVSRSVERRSRLTVCGCSSQGRDAEGRLHYELTLGRELDTGGYSVEGSLWVAVEQ